MKRLWVWGAISIKPDAEIDLARRKVKLLSPPRHTSSSVSLFDPAANLLFTGDLIYSTTLFAFDISLRLSAYVRTFDRDHLIQQFGDHLRTGLGQIVDHIVMMPAGRDDLFDVGTQAGPDIGQKRGLADEFRPFVGTHPGGHLGSGTRHQECWTFRCGFSVIKAQITAHFSLQQRPEIMQSTDRKRLGHPASEGLIGAAEPDRQMAAGGMAGQSQFTGDLFADHAHRARDLADDLADPRFGAQGIARHGDRPAMRHRSLRQMRPARFVEGQPVAAMDEDDRAARSFGWQEQIVALALARAVRLVEMGGRLGAE